MKLELRLIDDTGRAFVSWVSLNPATLRDSLPMSASALGYELLDQIIRQAVSDDN